MATGRRQDWRRVAIEPQAARTVQRSFFDVVCWLGGGERRLLARFRTVVALLLTLAGVPAIGAADGVGKGVEVRLGPLRSEAASGRVDAKRPGKSSTAKIGQEKHTVGKKADAKRLLSRGKAPSAKRKAVAPKSTGGRRPAGGGLAPAGDLVSFRAADCRERIVAVVQPARVATLAEECVKQLSPSPFSDEFRRIEAGARTALEGQRSAAISGDLFADSAGDRELRELVGRAARGDMDAAYGVAEAYKSGRSGVASNMRRTEQWLRYSAELGHGRASWELAEHYNYTGLVADAARFERKALDLGYRPAVRLPSRGY